MNMFDYELLSMTMYDYVWLCMNRICMTKYDYIWLNMNIYDYARLCMIMNNFVWLCMTINEYVKSFHNFSI